MGETELGHRSCSENISIDLRSRWSRRWNMSSKELGGIKVTMKTICVDL